MNHLVDTDWLIDALEGRRHATTVLDQLSDDGFGVSIVAVGELYEGAFGFPDPQDALSGFRRFLAGFAILPLSEPIMEIFAEERARLRGLGMLIPDFDIANAATALAHHLTLITRNRRHFERIPGLRLVSATWRARRECPHRRRSAAPTGGGDARSYAAGWWPVFGS